MSGLTSKRVVVSSVIAVAAIGAIAAGGLAMASDPTELSLRNNSVRYTAPAGDKAGQLTFTTEASDDAGIREVRVVAWPAGSELDPTEKEMRSVESADCESTDDETSRCTYTLPVSKKEAAELPAGTWYVSALATSKDDTTLFAPKAATFTVPN